MSSVSRGAESDRTWTAFEKTIPCAHKAVVFIILYCGIWDYLFVLGETHSLCSFEKCELMIMLLVVCGISIKS